MNPAALIYVIGYPFAVMLIMVEGERRRRESTDPFERQATLRPALDGVIVGLVWPLVAAGALGLGLLWLLSRLGRALA